MPLPVSISRSFYGLWHMLRHPSLRGAIARQLGDDRLTRPQLRQLQLERLQQLFRHAWDNCPFYRARFAEAGFVEGRINSLDELAGLPLLARSDIQQNRDDMVGRNFSRKQLRADFTGGSSGDPMNFFTDLAHFPDMSARRYRGDMMTGWDFGKRVVLLWGSQLDTVLSEKIFRKFYRTAVNEMFVNCSKLEEVNYEKCLRRIEAYRPDMILAYPTVVSIFAEKALEFGVTGIRPQSVVLSAENEIPGQRKLMKQVFGCEVFNRYGSREISIIACECDRHNGRHVLADQVILEIVDDAGRPLPPGEMGWVAITDLFNYGMPFIRYKIGDMGILDDEPCSCGRSSDRLVDLVGGTIRTFHLPSGWLVGPAMVTTLSKKLTTASNYQLLRNSETKFTLRILRGPNFDESELPPAMALLEKTMGPGVTLSWEYVNSVIRSPNGKHDFLVLSPPEQN